MSERKTAEIKFRVRPSDKARWQAEAEANDVSLSELIVLRMTEHASTVQNIEHTIKSEETFPLGMPNPFVARELTLEEQSQFAAPFTGTPTPIEELLDAEDLAAVEDADDEEPTGYCAHGKHNWQFCEACYEAAHTR